MLVMVTASPRDTEVSGELLGSLAVPGDIFCLFGDLGAGKTCFARGVARGLKVLEPVTSPTFTLINEYQGRLPLYHMDVYRLQEAADMEDLGYEEYFYGAGVTVLEWAERVQPVLPGSRLEIYIERLSDDENGRSIKFKAFGARYVDLVKELTKNVCPGN